MAAPSFQRLLLATEHSEHDEGAEALAFALAAQSRQPLAAVLPLISNLELEMAAPQLAARLDAEAARGRRGLEATARGAGVELALHVRRGAELFEEVVAEAHERAADLLVIRRRGRRGLLANLLVGEMVSKVVAHAPCSVLVVPRGSRLWQQGVLVGLDPQAQDAPAQTQALTWAAALAAERGLPLTVLCAAEHAAARPEAERALAAALPSALARHVSTTGEVRLGRAHQVLIDTARERGADLIVVARHSGTRLARAWIGGTTQKVIGLADCPVLVHIQPPKAATS